MKPAVALVGAETPGNVGTVARAMKNFDFEELLLIDPPALDPDGEAYGFAGRAREDVLPNAVEISFDVLIESYSTVGFTAITNESAARHVRYPFSTPRDLVGELQVVEGPLALVFGPERIGLTNDQLARIDSVCSIPASADYPVLNLGQAVTVALYELRELALDDTQHPDRRDLADPAEAEAFFAHVEAFLGDLDYPVEKRDKTLRLVRRLVGRARPTGRELKTLRGVLRRAGQRVGADGQRVDRER